MLRGGSAGREIVKMVYSPIFAFFYFIAFPTLSFLVAARCGFYRSIPRLAVFAACYSAAALAVAAFAVFAQKKYFGGMPGRDAEFFLAWCWCFAWAPVLLFASFSLAVWGIMKILRDPSGRRITVGVRIRTKGDFFSGFRLGATIPFGYVDFCGGHVAFGLRILPFAAAELKRIDCANLAVECRRRFWGSSFRFFSNGSPEFAEVFTFSDSDAGTLLENLRRMESRFKISVLGPAERG